MLRKLFAMLLVGLSISTSHASDLKSAMAFPWVWLPTTGSYVSAGPSWVNTTNQTVFIRKVEVFVIDPFINNEFVPGFTTVVVHRSSDGGLIIRHTDKQTAETPGDGGAVATFENEKVAPGDGLNAVVQSSYIGVPNVLIGVWIWYTDSP